MTFCVLTAAGCRTTSSEKREASQLHLQIATSHLKSENYPMALKELLVSQDLDPNNAETQAQLGLVYFMRERYELSEKHYRRAIALRPEFTDAKNNLARSYIELGHFKKAEVVLQDVLNDLTYSDFPRALANYGVLEFKRKNYPKAVEYLKKSLERDRENCFTQVFLGRSYLEMQDLKTAIKQLDRAVGFCLPVDSDEAHYYSAIGYFRDNQKDQSKLRFEELVKLFPNGPHAEKSRKMLELIDKGTL
jgi:Tfp pilus assembly protein PilF